MDSPPGSEMILLPRVEVLNTGTELLFGSVLNTHLSFLAQQIFPLGLRVQRQATVPDGSAIHDAILESATRCEIILVTGGLGPTTDDMTREIVAELTNRPLCYHDSIFQRISARFRRRGLHLTERISRQAYVPEGAVALPNDFGTAPGFYIPARDKMPHLFLFPGPPRELAPMFATYAVPILRELIPDHDLHAVIFRMTGIGESYVEKLVGEKLLAIPGLELGYCARLGEVDLRVIGGQTAVSAAEKIVRTALAQHIIGDEAKELEEVVIQLLREKNATLSVAESCTGGLLADRLTDVPGSSAVFLEGNVTYSNEAKTRTLGVPVELFSSVGAVSEEVACAMAEGVLQRSGATYSLSTTGIAGPAGGTLEKPVGTVFIALASKNNGARVEKLFFPSDRRSFKRICTQHALEMLRRKIG
jgi:nicotinamide-nucleotide amidase